MLQLIIISASITLTKKPGSIISISYLEETYNDTNVSFCRRKNAKFQRTQVTFSDKNM